MALMAVMRALGPELLRLLSFGPADASRAGGAWGRVQVTDMLTAFQAFEEVGWAGLGGKPLEPLEPLEWLWCATMRCQDPDVYVNSVAIQEALQQKKLPRHSRCSPLLSRLGEKCPDQKLGLQQDVAGFRARSIGAYDGIRSCDVLVAHSRG